jgi:PA14 domain
MLSVRSTIMLPLAALFVAGCTITTYSPPPPPPPGAPPQAQPTAQAPVKKPTTRRPAKTPPKTTVPTPNPDLAPVITSNIAFGGPKKKSFKGHAYVLPPDTMALPNLSSMVPFATLYTDRFNVQAQDFAGGFPGALPQEEWFAIQYQGPFELPTDGEWTFKLVSDDGAALYIDGERVVNNDGQHGTRAATGKKQLKAGQHALRLDYFQARKGGVALQVFTVVNNEDRLLIGQ